MKADLHIHTTVSDGSDTIAEVIETARRKGLDAIAVTDHDTFAHVRRLPVVQDLIIIGGIEISAIHRPTMTRTHILGYNLQDYKPVEALTRPLLEGRSKNSEKQAAILAKEGFQIDFQQLARADGKYLYKQHILDWLVKTGQIDTMFGSFYRETFKNGGICAFDITYIDVFEAVQAIKAGGGAAVLAHAGQQQNFQLIPSLVANGLDGLELHHHANGKRDKEILMNYAREYHLFLTGGSDYHGRYEPADRPAIGDILSEESGIRALLADKNK